MTAVRRRHFLGAGAAGALTLAGCGSSGGKGSTTAGGAPTAGLPGAPDDGAVLAFMLPIEQLQLDLYNRIQPFFAGGELDLIRTLAGQENQHVGKLTGELKARRRPLPRPLKLRAVPADRASALALAYRLENLAAAAYLGQVPRLVDNGVLADVLSLQSIEGRHAAAVGAMLNKTATPDGAISEGHDMATIQQALGAIAA